MADAHHEIQKVPPGGRHMNIIVLGEMGIGKSSFIYTFLYFIVRLLLGVVDHNINLNAVERGEIGGAQTNEIVTYPGPQHIRPGHAAAKVFWFRRSNGLVVKFTITDTPGFHGLNIGPSVEEVLRHIKNRARRPQDAVHLAVLAMPPHRFNPDVHGYCLQRLSKMTTVALTICKADALCLAPINEWRQQREFLLQTLRGLKITLNAIEDEQPWRRQVQDIFRREAEKQHGHPAHPIFRIPDIEHALIFLVTNIRSDVSKQNTLDTGNTANANNNGNAAPGQPDEVPTPEEREARYYQQAAREVEPLEEHEALAPAGVIRPTDFRQSDIPNLVMTFVGSQLAFEFFLDRGERIARVYRNDINRKRQRNLAVGGAVTVALLAFVALVVRTMILGTPHAVGTEPSFFTIPIMEDKDTAFDIFSNDNNLHLLFGFNNTGTYRLRLPSHDYWGLRDTSWWNTDLRRPVAASCDDRHANFTVAGTAVGFLNERTCLVSEFQDAGILVQRMLRGEERLKGAYVDVEVTSPAGRTFTVHIRFLDPKVQPRELHLHNSILSGHKYNHSFPKSFSDASFKGDRERAAQQVHFNVTTFTPPEGITYGTVCHVHGARFSGKGVETAILQLPENVCNNKKDQCNLLEGYTLVQKLPKQMPNQETMHKPTPARVSCTFTAKEKGAPALTWGVTRAWYYGDRP